MIKSALLSNVDRVRHGFGTRLEPRIDETAGAPIWKQVHGAACAEVTQAGQDCGQVDALWSAAHRVSGIPISVATADCVPILLARKDGARVAAVHAGWRGTRARITRHLWSVLENHGERAADWVAAIGPAIGPCCYEVSEELAVDFTRAFGSRAVPSHRILDLPGINSEELTGIGIGQVDLIRACTRCARAPDGSFLFHSYRREGGAAGRQLSTVIIQG